MAKVPYSTVGIGVTDFRWRDDNIGDKFWVNGTNVPGSAISNNNFQNAVPVVHNAQHANLTVTTSKNGNPSIQDRGAAFLVGVGTNDTDMGHVGFQEPQTAIPTFCDSVTVHHYDIERNDAESATVYWIETVSKELRVSTIGTAYEATVGTLINTATTNVPRFAVACLPSLESSDRPVDENVIVLENGDVFRYRVGDPATQIGSNCFAGVALGTVTEMDACYVDGLVLCVVSTASTVTTFASSDMGVTFVKVSDFAGTSARVDCSRAGTAILLYRQYTGGAATDVLFVKRLKSAFTRGDNVADITVLATGTSFNDPYTGDIACDRDGRMFIYAKTQPPTSGVNAFNHSPQAWFSDTDGESWTKLSYTPFGTSSATLFTAQWSVRACAANGFMYLPVMDTIAGASTHFINTLVCGGWANVTNGPDHTTATRHGAISTQYTAQGTTTGTSDTTTSSHHNFFAGPGIWGGALGSYETGTASAFTNPASNSFYQYQTQTNQQWLGNRDATYSGVATKFCFTIRQQAGGATTTDRSWVEVFGHDGSNWSKCKVRFSSTSIRVLNNTATVSALPPTDPDAITQYCIYFNGAGTWSVFWRQDLLLPWTRACTFTGSSMTPGDNVVHGIFNNHASSNKYVYHFSFTQYGQSIKTGYDSSGSISEPIGKRLAAHPYPVPIGSSGSDVCYMTVDGGFAQYFVQPDWTINMDGERPRSNLFDTSPSPDVTTEVTTGAQMICTMSNDEDHLTNTTPTSLPFVLIRNTNIDRMQIQTKLGATVQHSALYDFADPVVGGAGTQVGLSGTFVPALGSTGTRPLQQDELVGSHLLWTNGTTGTTHRVPILGNTSGWWTLTATKKAEIYVNPTLVPPAVLDTAGTVEVINKDMLIIDPRIKTAGSFDSVHITWNLGSTTPYTNATFGNIIFGSIHVPGKRWGNGWTTRIEPNVEQSVDAYGTVRMQQQGPNRRTLTVNFTDGQIQKRFKTSDKPDTVEVGNSVVAMDQDVYSEAKGALYRAMGGERMVVAVQEIKNSATAQLIFDKEQYVAGFLDGQLQVAHVSGEFGEEYVRVESMTIIEAV